MLNYVRPILGPLLFIIYINDIIHSSTVFKFIIFADDTTLYATLDTQEDINDILNDELVQINNWLKVNKLSVNVAKTKAMLFHMPQKQIHNPRLTIAGSNIEFIDNFNFLGITIIIRIRIRKVFIRSSQKVDTK